MSRFEQQFSAKVPTATFYVGDLCCHLTTGNAGSCKGAALLGAYVRIDPRLAQLAGVFRYWAKVRRRLVSRCRRLVSGSSDGGDRSPAPLSDRVKARSTPAT